MYIQKRLPEGNSSLSQRELVSSGVTHGSQTYLYVYIHRAVGVCKNVMPELSRPLTRPCYFVNRRGGRSRGVPSVALFKDAKRGPLHEFGRRAELGVADDARCRGGDSRCRFRGQEKRETKFIMQQSPVARRLSTFTKIRLLRGQHLRCRTRTYEPLEWKIGVSPNANARGKTRDQLSWH